MNKKILIFVLCIFVILIAFISVRNDEDDFDLEIDQKIIDLIEQEKYDESDEETNIVKITIKNYGDIFCVLYPDVAPITVKNFKKLVKDSFYNNLTFHRVINNFMIQTGNPSATGSGGSNENIKGEFKENGFNNKLSHVRGVLSMARRGAQVETSETYNSASSQFFIVQSDSTYLDGKYAAFGKVIYGIEIVDSIAVVETDENDKPIKDIVIDSIKFIKVSDENE